MKKHFSAFFIKGNKTISLEGESATLKSIPRPWWHMKGHDGLKWISLTVLIHLKPNSLDDIVDPEKHSGESIREWNK